MNIGLSRSIPANGKVREMLADEITTNQLTQSNTLVVMDR